MDDAAQVMRRKRMALEAQLRQLDEEEAHSSQLQPFGHQRSPSIQQHNQPYQTSDHWAGPSRPPQRYVDHSPVDYPPQPRPQSSQHIQPAASTNRYNPSQVPVPSREQVHKYLIAQTKDPRGLDSGWEIGGHRFDVNDLFTAVVRLQGSSAVSSRNQWPIIASLLGFPTIRSPDGQLQSTREIGDALRKFFLRLLGGLEILWERTKSADDGQHMERGPSETLPPIRTTSGGAQPTWATSPIQVTGTQISYGGDRRSIPGTQAQPSNPAQTVSSTGDPAKPPRKHTKKAAPPSTRPSAPASPPQGRTPSMPFQMNNPPIDPPRHTHLNPSLLHTAPAQPQIRQTSVSTATGPPGSFGNPTQMRVNLNILRPPPTANQPAPQPPSQAMPPTAPAKNPSSSSSTAVTPVTARFPDPTSSSTQLAQARDGETPIVSNFEDLVRSNILPLPVSPVASSVPANTTQYYAMRCHELRAAIKRMTSENPLRTVTKEELVFWGKLLKILQRNPRLLIPALAQVTSQDPNGGISASTLSLATTTEPAETTDSSMPSASQTTTKKRGRPRKFHDANADASSQLTAIRPPPDPNAPLKVRKPRRSGFILGRLDVDGEMVPIFGLVNHTEEVHKVKTRTRYSKPMIEMDGEMHPVIGPLTEAEAKRRRTNNNIGVVEVEGLALPIYGPLNYRGARKSHVTAKTLKLNLGTIEVDGEKLPIYGPLNSPNVKKSRGRPRLESEVEIGPDGEITLIEPLRKKRKIQGSSDLGGGMVRSEPSAVSQVAQRILGLFGTTRPGIAGSSPSANGEASAAILRAIEARKRGIIPGPITATMTSHPDLLRLIPPTEYRPDAGAGVPRLSAAKSKGKGKAVQPHAPIRRPVASTSSLPLIRFNSSPAQRIHLSGGTVSAAKMRRNDMSRGNLYRVKKAPKVKMAGKSGLSQSLMSGSQRAALGKGPQAPLGQFPASQDIGDIDILGMDFNVVDDEPFDVTQEIDLDFPSTLDGVAIAARPATVRGPYRKSKGIKAIPVRRRRGAVYVELSRPRPQQKGTIATVAPRGRVASGQASSARFGRNPLPTRKQTQSSTVAGQTAPSRTLGRAPTQTLHGRPTCHAEPGSIPSSLPSSSYRPMTIRPRRSPSIVPVDGPNAVAGPSRPPTPRLGQNKTPAETPGRKALSPPTQLPETPSSDRRRCRLIPYVELPTSSRKPRPKLRPPVNRLAVVLPVTRSRRRLLISRGRYIPFRDDDSDTETNPRGRNAHIPLRPLKPLPRGSIARMARPSEPEPIPRRFVVRPGPGIVEPFKSVLQEGSLEQRLEEIECGWKGCEAVLASEGLLRKHLEVRQHWKQGKFVAGIYGKEVYWRCHWVACEGPCFKDEGELRQHIEARHVGKVLSCPYIDCRLASPNISHLARHVMKQHDSPNDMPVPLANLSARLPPDALPDQVLPQTARTDQLTTPLITGTTPRSAFRRQLVKDKIQKSCLAGPDPVLHVEHPPHMLEQVEGSMVPDEVIANRNEDGFMGGVSGKKRKWRFSIELPGRKKVAAKEKGKMREVIVIEDTPEPVNRAEGNTEAMEEDRDVSYRGAMPSSTRNKQSTSVRQNEEASEEATLPERVNGQPDTSPTAPTSPPAVTSPDDLAGVERTELQQSSMKGTSPDIGDKSVAGTPPIMTNTIPRALVSSIPGIEHGTAGEGNLPTTNLDEQAVEVPAPPKEASKEQMVIIPKAVNGSDSTSDRGLSQPAQSGEDTGSAESAGEERMEVDVPLVPEIQGEERVAAIDDSHNIPEYAINGAQSSSRIAIADVATNAEILEEDEVLQDLATDKVNPIQALAGDVEVKSPLDVNGVTHADVEQVGDLPDRDKGEGVQAVLLQIEGEEGVQVVVEQAEGAAANADDGLETVNISMDTASGMDPTAEDIVEEA